MLYVILALSIIAIVAFVIDDRRWQRERNAMLAAKAAKRAEAARIAKWEEEDEAIYDLPYAKY